MYSYPVQQLINTQNTQYTTKMDQPWDFMQITRDNTEPPALFLITPALLQSFISFFYFSKDRIPPVIYWLGRHGYLSLTLFSEYYGYPSVDVGFGLNSTELSMCVACPLQVKVRITFFWR